MSIRGSKTEQNKMLCSGLVLQRSIHKYASRNECQGAERVRRTEDEK